MSDNLRDRALAAWEKAQQENAERGRQLREQERQYGIQCFRELLESVLGIKDSNALPGDEVEGVRLGVDLWGGVTHFARLGLTRYTCPACKQKVPQEGMTFTSLAGLGEVLQQYGYEMKDHMKKHGKKPGDIATEQPESRELKPGDHREGEWTNTPSRLRCAIP